MRRSQFAKLTDLMPPIIEEAQPIENKREKNPKIIPPVAKKRPAAKAAGRFPVAVQEPLNDAMPVRSSPQIDRNEDSRIAAFDKHGDALSGLGDHAAQLLSAGDALVIERKNDVAGLYPGARCST